MIHGNQTEGGVRRLKNYLNPDQMAARVRKAHDLGYSLNLNPSDSAFYPNNFGPSQNHRPPPILTLNNTRKVPMNYPPRQHIRPNHDWPRMEQEELRCNCRVPRPSNSCSSFHSCSNRPQNCYRPCRNHSQESLYLEQARSNEVIYKCPCLVQEETPKTYVLNCKSSQTYDRTQNTHWCTREEKSTQVPEAKSQFIKLPSSYISHFKCPNCSYLCTLNAFKEEAKSFDSACQCKSDCESVCLIDLDKSDKDVQTFIEPHYEPERDSIPHTSTIKTTETFQPEKNQVFFNILQKEEVIWFSS